MPVPNDPPQPSLFDEVYVQGWPRLTRFPHNDAAHGVGGVVDQDLRASRNPLVITGYASVDRLIEWLARCHARLSRDASAHASIRLLLGNEPHPSRSPEFRSSRRRFSREVVDYWLERGVSLYASAKVIAAVELLRSGIVQVRIASERPVHAKVYVGDEAVTIGSSNFTRSGLELQVEANTRFTPADGQRWREARGLAEQIWTCGEDFLAGFIELLEQLLRCVRWEEALSRACAELLEGSWASRFQEESPFSEGERLWPSQAQGIAHALWVLEQQGSVLIADATGSGKTLMGAHLIKRVMNRLSRPGRRASGVAVLMAPPAVLPDWLRHASECGATLRAYSQGHLSSALTSTGTQLRREIRRARVLAVDEAHNFLRRSQRTTALFSNIADHVLLFTATPVNRGPRDLLAMIDLLGPDNLDDDTLSILERLWRRRGDLRDTLSQAESDQLRRAIRRFTIRRTKADLNRMVDVDPEAYRGVNGRVCRYPTHRALPYTCDEPDDDLKVASRIRSTAARLRGLTRLSKILENTDGYRAEGLTDEAYLRGRLRGAAALAAHEVAAGLRSSRVRLLEHLRGTQHVLAMYPELQHAHIAKKPGVIDVLDKLAGHPPRSRLNAPLPEWLSDAEEHRRACDEERTIYEEIESLALQLSDKRERTKAALLSTLAHKHRLVLAFDSHLITLAYLRERLRQAAPSSGLEVIVATGEAAAARKRLYHEFRPHGGAKGIVALCSDALAEGVNLQGASVVVMLDMPSVIRVAEQRIGRVDRMNSPHDVIEAYWPIDPEPFAVRASERLIERHRFVARNLGANLQLPHDLAGDADPVVRYEDYVSALASGSTADEAMEDVLSPVRALVEGPRAIIPATVYASLRQSTARVVSSVSVVHADVAFAFIAISGTGWGAPMWAYLPNLAASPTTDVADICAALRRHLGPDTKERELDDTAAAGIERVLTALGEHERDLLPRGKQRALTEMVRVLRSYRREGGDARRMAVIEELLGLLEEKQNRRSIDYGALADWWLRTIQPVKFRHLEERTRMRPVLLRNLRKDLTSNPLSTEQLESAFEVPLFAPPLDERVVAAIVGVP